MTTKEILDALNEMQNIQMQNPPTSAKWQAASAEIHRLAERLTGKPPVVKRCFEEVV